MKKNSLIIIFLCVFGFISTKAQNSYDISFFIHESQDSMIYIEGYCGYKTILIDSIYRQKDDSFRWIAKDKPQGLYVVKNKKENMFSFVLGNSKKFSIEIYPSGEFFVKGCPENDAYLLYQKRNKTYALDIDMYKNYVRQTPEKKDSLYAAISKEIDSFQVFQQQFYKAYPENLITVVSQSMMQVTPNKFLENGKLKKGMEMEYATYYRQHYWDSFHFNDIRILYTPYFMKKYISYITEITMQNPDTINEAIDEFITKAKQGGGQEYADYIVAYYLDNLPKLPFSFNEITYTHIVDKYVNEKSTYLSPSEIEYHKKNVNDIRKFLPGNIMPNIVLRDFEGKEQSLYKIKAKYTVLYFFSSTCESCKKNLDVLKDLYKNKKQEYDLEVYSVDLEQDEAICKARQEADPFPWIVTHASAEYMQKYGFDLEHTPEIYVLDASKHIINKTAIYAHIEETIQNINKLKSK
jgi:peroxiredoxin